MQWLPSAGTSIVCILLVCACGPEAAPGPSPVHLPGEPVQPARIGRAIAALESAASYRLNAATRDGRTTFRHEYLVVRPQSGWSLRVESSSGVLQLIAIGNAAWIAETGQRLESISPRQADSRAAGYDVPGIMAAYTDPALSAALSFVARERKNGVDAEHFRADAAALRRVRPAVLSTASLDVWIAAAGYLSALEAIGVQSSDTDARVDVHAVNDPANIVRPPQ
jgi:hypothetical protein